MNLYQKLFGTICLKPLDDGEGGTGGAVDRGDDFAPAPAGEDKDKGDDTSTVEDDLKQALGEGKDEQPRDAGGKFAKKDKEDDEPRIPKSRFDEQIRKEREAREAAERELADIRRAQQQIARGADIGKLEEHVKELRAQERKALISGDDDKAAELSTQADALNRQIAIEQSRDLSAQAKEQAREEIRWDLTVERIEEQYPALDEKSDTFDQDLTDDVVDKMNGYMQRERIPRSQALLKAVKYVMDRRTSADETKDEPADKPKGLDRGAPQDRKQAAVAKNIDAAARQPASTKKAGADSDKHGQTAPTPEADDMTYEEFSALPESTKAKMRGDYV